ncbi:MAG: glycosyltransferase family 4 protein [Kiritimatiellae bacterium]|nr:glycosyltransferase family 4 protein [Kiritimatiellia bacterium]
MRVAFVAPFYGSKAAGGAESECRQTAIHLAGTGVEVDIFTTCALDLVHGWNVAYHKAGTFHEDGLRVHRFPAEPIDQGSFDQINTRLMTNKAISNEDGKKFIASHVSSTELLRALAKQGSQFDWIFFIPYLFGTSCHGSALWPERSILIPCLHDEPYARIQCVKHMFERVARIVFHTRAELAIAERLYGKLGNRALLIGEGIDTPPSSKPDRFRTKYGISEPFLLYAGRKDSTKNVQLLLNYFTRYRQRRKGDVRLILIGPGSIPLPTDCGDSIMDLGFIPLEEKQDAYAAATVFCQPSLNESFSIVIMESWMYGVPCLVHEGCAVTRDHAIDSGGGLYFENYAEFEGCLDHLLARPALRKQMGAAGRRYVFEHFTWDRIITKYTTEVLARPLTK